MLGKRITSAAGNNLGTVRNLILGKDGQITAVIVEGDPSTPLREFMFRIPWQHVEAAKLPGRLIADINPAGHPLYGIFGNDGQQFPEEFAVTEVTGDYARLQAGQGYGYVSDAVFTRAGDLIAVLITRDSKAGGGTYAFGFPEHPVERWNAGATYYGLPYATAEHADAAAIRVDLTRFRSDGDTGAG
ncbi:PRC-barrel domain-containing protein [Bradyrhizobium sp. USDA 10063]